MSVHEVAEGIVRTRPFGYTAESRVATQAGAGGGQTAIEPTALARILAEAASEAKAENVVVLDIHDLTIIADYFVICDGDNERLLRAINRQLVEAADKIDLDPRRMEGSAESGWIVIDFADVIVHIFGREQRQFYRLEEVWSEAQTLLVLQ